MPAAQWKGKKANGMKEAGSYFCFLFISLIILMTSIRFLSSISFVNFMPSVSSVFFTVKICNYFLSILFFAIFFSGKLTGTIKKSYVRTSKLC